MITSPLSILSEIKEMVSKIRKCRPNELNYVTPLFAGWEETMIWSCLQNVMGSIYAEENSELSEMQKTEEISCTAVQRTKNQRRFSSAAALMNDFCFLAGEPSAELAAFDYGKEFLVMVPQNEKWSEMIEKVHGQNALRQTRYAIKKEKDCFDRTKLLKMVEGLAKPYRVRKIDRELYAQCLENAWSRDLVLAFPTYEEFEGMGLGFVVTDNDVIVSGASTYSRYREGIEIEIDTREDYRRKGLASVCASALILECLKQGLYPSWDAHNKASVALSEKLGYTFSHEYPVYEIRRKK